MTHAVINAILLAAMLYFWWVARAACAERDEALHLLRRSQETIRRAIKNANTYRRIAAESQAQLRSVCPRLDKAHDELDRLNARAKDIEESLDPQSDARRN